MEILHENFKQFMRNLRQRQFRDKTAYVGGQDFRPQLRFSCSVASVLQRFVPPCIVMTILILITTVIVIL